MRYLSKSLPSCTMLSVVVLLALTGAASAGYNCEPGKDVMVHLFEWRWDDIANECENFLGPRGYCAVQISPPSEHAVITFGNWRPWWERYQPVSYHLNSRSGDEAALRNMVERCNNAGVRIYADVVINHMTGDGEGTGSGGSFWTTGGTLVGDESYPGVPFGPMDFNGHDECPKPNLGIDSDYHDAVIVRNCRLVGLRDLKMATGYVRGKVIDFMNSLIDMGVAGFRVDACKHMWPGDLDIVFGGLNNLPQSWFPPGTRPFIFQEVIDLYGSEAVTADEYTHLGRVTEFKYGLYLSEVILKLGGQQLSYLRNFGEGWGMMSRFDAAIFIDNHDNQRNHGGGGPILTHKEPAEYKLAVGFMLAWDYGYPRVMSSYYFEDTEAGPPSNGNGDTNPVDCFNDWVCEHRWRQIYNMVRFHNLAIGHDVGNWWDNNGNQIAFSRGSQGFVAMNNENHALDMTLQTGLPSGEYCDVLSCENAHPPCGEGSNCRNPITVNGDGTASIFISNDYNYFSEVPMIAIHV